MHVREIGTDELVAASLDSFRSVPWCDPRQPSVVVVDLRSTHALDLPEPPAAFRSAPAVFVGLVDRDAETGPAGGIGWCDVEVTEGTSRAQIDAIASTVTRSPLASTAFAQLLRGAGERSVADGLLLESAVYSTLQGGPELAAWLASRPIHDRADEAGPRVRVARDGAVLCVTLDRPHVRNALDSRLRDELLAALDLARWDDGVRTIELSGNGPAYSSGGDLHEFGSFGDPASAHLVRQAASLAAVFHELRDRLVVHVHGACRGSGIELPAFAHRVIAASDTTFGLPELSLGLVPGAGGTVSLPARIGRHRTAWLGLTGAVIDAPTALTWGLVDVIDDGRITRGVT